jgi:hypothetical protein
MPTPAIQTLRTDAQQVLNLDSISAVRSVVAATLANANAGTPLNPNLTTQQLWNEFYQIITQPKSDIESIIANQLMKFLFAPPAPGGVGADQQVIFNDGGVLAGDPQFLWNKTTNLLTVTGSATITGDLTVDTSTLKVDSANDKVGFGTTSPFTRADSLSSRNTALGSIAAFNTMPLSVTDDTAFAVGVGGGLNFRAKLTSSTYSTYAGIWSYRESALNSDYAGSLIFGTSDNSNGYPIERFRISSSGVATWSNVGGVAGTAMTLNSTGLGVGASPVEKLTVAGAAEITGGVVGQGCYLVRDGASGGGTYSAKTGNVSLSAPASGTLRFNVNGGTLAAQIDTSGNVGVGVTPSAWNSAVPAIQVKGVSGIYGAGSSEFGMTQNNFYNASGQWIYGTTAAAGRYAISSGVHQWYTAASGTINTQITDFATAKMTLDASGNLLVACTSSPTGTTSGFYFDSTHYTYFSRSAGETLNLNRYTSTGATAKFRYAGTEVGDISVTGSGTTFNSISDYRLKESVTPLSGGLARVNALKPSIYKWKSDGSNGEGFIAHELAEVVPLAVTGEKDAVNEDGSIKPQGVDLSRVVPILVAAIKELAAEVNALKNA